MKAVFTRVKRCLGKIRSWLTDTFGRVRRWPKAFWNRLVAVPGCVKRWLTKRWPVKLLFLLAVVLFTALALSYSVPRMEPLTYNPKVSAKWVPQSRTVNFLGLPIDVYVEITSPPQVVVNLDSLPQEGEMLGTFDIWRRQVRCRQVGDEKITRVHYRLLYLLPLKSLLEVGERKVFNSQELPKFWVNYQYPRKYSLSGSVYPVKGVAVVQADEIAIARRVGPDDEPYPLAGPVSEKFRFGKILRIGGAVIVLLIPIFWFFKNLVDIVAEIDEELQRRAEYRAPSELLQEVWGLWLETGDYRYFLQAAILVRNNLRHQLGLPPGGLLPRGNLWSMTTEALYSGRVFIEERVRSGFSLFQKTVRDEADKDKP